MVGRNRAGGSVIHRRILDAFLRGVVPISAGTLVVALSELHLKIDGQSIGYLWRSFLLGMPPIFGCWLVWALLEGFFDGALPGRFRRSFDRLGPATLGVLVFGGTGFVIVACAWTLLLLQWSYLDLPWYFPSIPWQQLVKERFVSVLVAAVCGFLFFAPVAVLFASWASRNGGKVHRLLRQFVGLAFASCAAAIAIYNFWVKKNGYLDALHLPLSSCAFMAAALGMRCLRPRLPSKIVSGTVAAVFILGCCGATILLAARLNDPDMPTRALLDQERPLVIRLAGRLARLGDVLPPGSPSVCPELVQTPPSEPAITPLNEPLPDVVLITVDALAVDRCSAYGYERQTTPYLDSLAQEGALFERAYSPGDSTLYGIAPVLLSRHQECLGRELPPKGILQYLGEAGYRTAVATGYDFRGGVTSPYSESLLAGVDSYVLAGPKTERAVSNSVSVDRTVAAAACEIAEEASTEKPLALWVHFYDPHNAHVPDLEYARRFGDDSSARVDAEVLTADQGIAKLLRRLAAVRGRPRLVVISADHGQSMGEDGRFGHGKGLYRSMAHVPLIFHGWRIPANVRVSNPASTIDVPPTLLSMVLGEIPEGMMGVSRLAELRGGVQASTPVFFSRVSPEWTSQKDGSWAVVSGDYWLSRHRRPSLRGLYPADYFELFDLTQDRNNLLNLASQRPEVVERLNGLLSSRGADSLDCWCASSMGPGSTVD